MGPVLSTTTADGRAEPVVQGTPVTGAAVRRPRRRARVQVYGPPRWYAFRLLDLWRYRALLRHFGKFYVKRRYRRTFLGWLWVPLRPAYDIVGRSILFGSLLAVSSGDRPYFMFFIIGSTAWRFVSMGMLQTTRALDVNRVMFGRVNLPRATAVAAALVPAGIEAGMYAVIGVAGAVYYKLTEGSFYIELGKPTLWAVFGFGLLGLYVFAFGLLVSPLAFHARDARYLVSYVIGLWYMITPIIYPISSIPASFQTLAEFNPLTAPVEFIKYGLLETSPPPIISLVVSLVVLAVILAVGSVTFARAEAKAAIRV